VVIPEEFGATRDELVAFLTSRRIETRNYYVPPVHRHRAYRDIGARFEAVLPITDWISERVTSLPIWTGLADDDVDYVCRCIEECYSVGSTFGNTEIGSSVG
jgi:dTDP-4-amino-4,6-dideoxygalactose transaminase